MSGWRLQLALLAVLAAQLGLFALGHRSNAELTAALDSPDPAVRIEARFLLLERGAVDRAEAERTLAATLLDSPDVLLRRKIGVVVGGSSGRIKRPELAWWLEAVEGRPLAADELLEWIAAHP